MMKNKKFALVSVLMLSVLSLLFTACNFGKDDFYGTWQTGEFVRSDNQKTVRVTFYFSGKAENLTTGDKAYFYELYENLTDNLKTFWWGTYGLGQNSDVTNGNLTLRYMYGVGLENVNDFEKLIADSQTVKVNKKNDTSITAFEDKYKNSTRWFDQFDEENCKCSDVETFRFKLDGAVAFVGYTQMVCTAKDMYREDGVDTRKINNGAADGSTKNNPEPRTSWGKAGDTRSFAMLRDNASQYGDGMDFSANIVSAPLPQLNVLSEYNEVALTPEK